MNRRCVSMNMNSRKLSGHLLPSSSSEDDVPDTRPDQHQHVDDDCRPPPLPPPPSEETMVHFSHPEHRLARFDLPYLFLCMGCKEYGAGKRFLCQTCGFQLHEFCALAPPALHGHPFHRKHPHLLFFAKPAPGGGGGGGFFLRCRCDLCGKAVRGFSFRCASCGFDMHPCCASMAARMDLPAAHQHPLLLAPERNGGAVEEETSFVCQVCRRTTKRSGPGKRVYRCLPCGYCIHARCAKDMVNGLYAHGVVPPEKRNALATAARVTVNALFGVIGGLIEGIGEGIGEAFVEGIGRSRRA